MHSDGRYTYVHCSTVYLSKNDGNCSTQGEAEEERALRMSTERKRIERKIKRERRKRRKIERRKRRERISIVKSLRILKIRKQGRGSN